MAIFGHPTDKTGGTGRRLTPISVRTGTSIRITGSYQFGEGGAGTYTHGIWISQPLNLGVAPHSTFTQVGLTHAYSEFGLVEDEVTAGVFSTPGYGNFFDLQSPAYPGSDIFVEVGGTMTLVLSPEDNGTVDLFPIIPSFYMIGVVENDTGPNAGTFTPGDLVDFMIVSMQADEQNVNQTIAGTINTTLLDTALGLAGHNLKVRNPSFINGLISEYELAIFDPDVDIGLDPDDLAVDTNLSETHTAIFTPDSQKNIQQDLTKPD